MRNEFATAEPPRIRVGIAAGRVEVEAVETDQTIIEVEAIRGDLDNLKVEQHGRDIVIEHRRKFGSHNDEYAVHVRAPLATELDLNLASADVTATGRLGKVEINTASGDVRIDEIEGDARIRSASGDVALGPVAGKVDVNSASGDVAVGVAGNGMSVRSASGDVRIGEGAKQASVQTASGDVLIESIAEGVVDLKSASGDLSVGIKQGSRLHVDARSLSGDTSSELELNGVEAAADGPLVEVKATTMSGDIRIVRAH